MLSYRKPKLSSAVLLACALALACVAVFLLLPGLALRFPALSSVSSSFGAGDRTITLLFAASTPVVIASRFKTILVNSLIQRGRAC